VGCTLCHLVKPLPHSLATMLLMAAIAAPIPAQAASDRLVTPRFVEETERVGIDHVYDGEWEFFVGGGVAVFDCDADERPDIYLAGGAGPASLYRNRSETGGALAFDVVAEATTDLTLVTGAYPLDIDSDDILDLVVLRRGENVVLRGLGDCTFERANEAWAIDGDADWTVAFSAKWEPGATLPTLAFGDYLVIDDRSGKPVCDESALLRPRPDGTGYSEPTDLRPGYCSLSLLFSDWDRSGRMDLRVTNDRHYYVTGEDQLWRVEPGKAPQLWTRDEGWRELTVWGMGIASQDITGDGLPEVFLTSMGDNKLQTLATGPERPSFEDIALERGVTAHKPSSGGEHQQSTAWHAEFDDVNNDGATDLFVSKGNVDAMPDFAQRDPNNLLLGRPDGSFVDAARKAGILDYERSRGASVADLNADGMLDLVVNERRVPVRLWRNVGRGSDDSPQPIGGWLAVELEQDGPNRDAIGAWIEVRAGGRTTAREVTVGGGHAGGALGPVHFGLGSAKNARVRVRWPDGTQEPWQRVKPDQVVRIERSPEAAGPTD
jgi:enediyne biosynthesis protein E4